jgi:hypothetical protein
MIDLHTVLQRNGRRILAGMILLISLLSAFALASQANNKTPMWAAKSQIHSGSLLKAGDLLEVRVSLGNQSPKYFSSKAKLIGNYSKRTIDQGELIPVTSITKSWQGLTLKEIPIGLMKNDFPSDLHSADLVDLYSIPVKDPKATTSLIVSKVQVASVDAQSQSMGGVVGVVFKVDPKDLIQLTDAIQAGRIVVVRNAL